MEQVNRQGSNLGRQLLKPANCLSFSHTVALKDNMRQEENLHIETFQLLLLGLLRVCRAWESEELHFKPSLGEKSLPLNSCIVTGLHFSAEALSY